MPNYRRNRVPGGTYFFTVTLPDRGADLLASKIDILRAAVRHVLQVSPSHIDAWVVLPDHMHSLWTLPAADTDYSGRWRAIKKRFSWSIAPTEPRSTVQQARAERGIWQRRFWEHTIRTERDYAAHMDYIHFNPVKHGLARSAAAWQFSSFHRAVKQGLYPPDWANAQEGEGHWGEREGDHRPV